MEALKKKLNSRRGASILLALLFMLMCILVAASVVMAASSNAGKIKSNKEEQQKYLTLSSALNLIVDELQSVEYVGGYTYDVKTTEIPATTETPGPDEPSAADESDEPATSPEPTIEITTYTYTLQPGDLQYQQAPSPSPALSVDDWGDLHKMGNLLPMDDYLDYFFAKEFSNKYHDKEDIGTTYETYYYYKCDASLPSTDGTTPPGNKYTLTLTVNDNNLGDLSKQQVKIDVEILEDGRIELTATLWEKPTADGNLKPTNYKMVAALTTQSGEWPVKVINLTAKEEKNPFDPVRWKLAYIYKVKDKVGEAG